jgi:hypothetical protein
MVLKVQLKDFILGSHAIFVFSSPFKYSFISSVFRFISLQQFIHQHHEIRTSERFGHDSVLNQTS